MAAASWKVCRPSRISFTPASEYVRPASNSPATMVRASSWRRWRYAKARAHLTVIPPEVSTIPKRSKTDERYLN